MDYRAYSDFYRDPPPPWDIECIVQWPRAYAGSYAGPKSRGRGPTREFESESATAVGSGEYIDSGEEDQDGGEDLAGGEEDVDSGEDDVAMSHCDEDAAAPLPNPPKSDYDRFNEIGVTAAKLLENGVVDPAAIPPHEGPLRMMPPECFWNLARLYSYVPPPVSGACMD